MIIFSIITSSYQNVDNIENHKITIIKSKVFQKYILFGKIHPFNSFSEKLEIIIQVNILKNISI